ncbi:MAG: excinuclease ABC subunit UvrC [Gammaproteobacteria bacterium]|nr:excinuclease ABC subunit UvrC [Gammaproteobacteria bacterium]
MPSRELLDTLSSLPGGPGVYRMLDQKGTILYVGKALNLKKRVTQYFKKKVSHPKTQALVQRIHAIEVTLTRSETEALLLENTLIKENKPKYNILLRDDKTYPYLFIDTAHAFPSLGVFRRKQRPKTGKVFGPYPNTQAVHQTLNLLQKCFKLRNCKDSTLSSRSRPCLQYQIKRCTAPCTGLISQEAYAQSVKHAIGFLQGKSATVLTQLSEEMTQAVTRLAFEEAARIRDQIQQLRLIQQSQAMIQGERDVDLVAMDVSVALVGIEHVVIRQGRIIRNQSYFPTLPPQVAEEATPLQLQALFEAFARFHYFEHPEDLPPVILIDPPLPAEFLQPYEQIFKQMTQHSCHLYAPSHKSEKGWLDFAKHNLQLHLAQRIKKANGFEAQFVRLQEMLSTSSRVQRGTPCSLVEVPRCARDDVEIQSIACFDISHTQGEAAIASCVVFTREGPQHSSYRRFSIEGITPGDDYAALRQAILKRYQRMNATDPALPDVVLIDGGKGQVNGVEPLFEQLQLSVRVLGITKGLLRQARFDRIYDARSATFLLISTDDPGLHLLQQVRDEAHRFALSRHRVKRSQLHMASTLNQIEGIGPKKRKVLLQHFGGIQALARASYVALCGVPGISPRLAQRLMVHFGSEESSER